MAVQGTSVSVSETTVHLTLQEPGQCAVKEMDLSQARTLMHQLIEALRRADKSVPYAGASSH